MKAVTYRYTVQVTAVGIGSSTAPVNKDLQTLLLACQL